MSFEYVTFIKLCRLTFFTLQQFFGLLMIKDLDFTHYTKCKCLTGKENIKKHSLLTIQNGR